MERLTKNNPQSNIDVLLNYAYVKDGEVYLRYAGGEEEKRLADYIAELATEKGCERTAEDILDDGCMECDCEVAVLNACAIQAAELRNRLAEYEDKLESGRLLDLPCDIGDWVYIVGNDRGWAKIDTIRIYQENNGKRKIIFEWVQYDVGVDVTEVWDDGEFDIEEFGKTVFTEKTHAEKIKELIQAENEKYAKWEAESQNQHKGEVDE